MKSRKLLSRGVVIVIIAIAAYVLLLGDYSIFNVGSLHLEKEQMKENLAGMREEKARLIEDREGIENDSLELEKLAREKIGMVKKGEKLLKAVVVDDPEDGTPVEGGSTDNLSGTHDNDRTE